MRKYYAEEAVVVVLGFVVGAALALAIVPGDIVLWLATGACLGLFSHIFFSKNFAGDLFWPFAERRRHRKHQVPRPRSTTPQSTMSKH